MADIIDMELLETATDWAQAEVFSSSFFVIFGVLFILASVGFSQLGITDIAKAYAIPTLVAGGLLLIIGLGLMYANKSRIITFETAYNDDASAFYEAEIARIKSTLKEYEIVVFTAIPLIIIACALIIIFTNTPLLRASVITTIAMLIVILLIDGTAQSRIEAYYEQLVSLKK